MKFSALLSGDRLLLIGALLTAAIGMAVGDSFDRRILAQAGIYAILALGYRQIFGRLGVLSLAQGAFFGLGAYALAIILVKAALPLPLALLGSIALPAVLAMAIALPLLRLESHYLALASLGLAQILLLAALNWQGLTGGANGVGGIAMAAFGGDAAGHGLVAAAIWLAVAAIAALIGWAGGGLRGLRQHLVREAPFAAASLGLDAGRLRLIALVLGAAVAGCAGASHALLNGVVSPDTLELGPMVLCLSIVVIGGRNGLGGILAAALLLAHLPEWLRWIGSWYLVAYAGAMLLVLIVAPYGLAGLADRLLPAAKPGLPPPTPPRALDGKSILRAAGLGKKFGGVHALQAVDLGVAGGQIVGLIGPNGAGKTTLLNAIGGQIIPDTGAILFNGRPIEKLPVHRRALLGLGRVFQMIDSATDMRAIDAVALAIAETNLERARAQARHWLDLLGLQASADAPISQLGIGARRRLEIARALAQRPTILLLDEPTAGLAPVERHSLASLLDGLRRDGCGLLIVEHDVAWLAALADNLYCLEGGRIVAAGDPADLRQRTELRRFFGWSPGAVPR